MRTALSCPEPPEDGPLLVSGVVTAASLSRGVVTVSSVASGVITAATITTHTIGGTGRHQEA